MITSVFNKSRPINYILIATLLILCFLLYQISIHNENISWLHMSKIGLYLLLLIGSLFLTNFITKKNGLSKDNSYTFLLFFVFLILFPKTLSNGTLIFSNGMILLALRRLISLQSQVATKEKIFDASLWILMASLLNFWCVLFMVLVYISIFLDAARDHRNWIIPIIAFGVVAVCSTLFSYIFNFPLSNYFKTVNIDFDLKYIENMFQNLALFIFILAAILAFFNMLYLYPKKLSNYHHSFQKIIIAFVIGLIVFFISPNKDNSLLIYTFVPVAIMLTNLLETIEKYWIKETILGIIITASIVTFVLQLL